MSPAAAAITQGGTWRLRPAAALRGIVRLLLPVSGLVALVLLWALASWLAANATLVPPPLLVARALAAMMPDELPGDILASLYHLGVGYGLGALTGLLLALAAARWDGVAAIVDPAAEFLRPISAIAWIPIAILLFGVGEKVPIFLIFYGSVFPIFVNALDGIHRVDRSLVNAARSLGASERMAITHVIFPAALPAILAGARLSLGVGWMAMVGGELVGADSGLGFRVSYYQEFFAMDRVVAVMVVIGVLGYLADSLLRLVQHGATGWSRQSGASR